MSRSGTERELQDMKGRCQKVGVAIYAEVVLNHMAAADSGQGFFRSAFRKYNYPGLFSCFDFHQYGRNGDDRLVNWADLFEVQNCELFRLADLKIASEKVIGAQFNYLNRLTLLGIIGFRVDAVKYMPSAEILQLLALVARNPYVIHEFVPGDEGLRYW